MSAVGLNLEARAAGVQLHVDGNDLVLQVSARSPKSLLDRLSRYKAVIVLRLLPEANVWSKEDWHALFDERAGMADSESGLPRDRAVARGFDHLLPYSAASRRCIRAVARHGSPPERLTPFRNLRRWAFRNWRNLQTISKKGGP